MPTLAAGASTTTSGYTYDDGGGRVSQTVNGTTTFYLVDANNLTGYSQVLQAEQASGGQTAGGQPSGTLSVTKTYTLGDVVLGQQSPGVAGGSALYFVIDGHGSTRLVLDMTGQQPSLPLDGGGSGVGVGLSRFAYDAYGNPLGFDPSQAVTSVLYSGQLFDNSTGLQYLRARYYNSSVGGFTSQDRFGGYLSSPQSLNGTAYCWSDPVGCYDPSGHDLTNILFGASFAVAAAGWMVQSLGEVANSPTAEAVGRGGMVLGAVGMAAALAAKVVPPLVGAAVAIGAQVLSYWPVLCVPLAVAAGEDGEGLAGDAGQLGEEIEELGQDAAEKGGEILQDVESGVNEFFSSAEGGGGKINAGNLKPVNVGDLKAAGVDIHEVKEALVGQGDVSKVNLQVDTTTGEVVVVPVRRGSGPPAGTGMTLDDIKATYGKGR